MKKSKSLFMAMFFLLSSASHSMNFESNGQNFIGRFSDSKLWANFCDFLVQTGKYSHIPVVDEQGEELPVWEPKLQLTRQGALWVALATFLTLAPQYASAMNSDTVTGSGKSLIPLNQNAVQPFAGNAGPTQYNLLAQAIATQIPPQENKYDSPPVPGFQYETPKHLSMENLVVSSQPSSKSFEWLFTTKDGDEIYYNYGFKEYKTKDTGHTVKVKKAIQKGRQDHSLMIAYLTDRLIGLYLPQGHSATIVPVLSDKGWMIAELDLPEFLPGNPHEIYTELPERSENSILLSLLLDFTDITERNRANIGTTIINGKRVAAVRGRDRSGNFRMDYLAQLVNDIYRDNIYRDNSGSSRSCNIIKDECKERFRSALATIASISEEEFEEKFNKIVQDFERALDIGNFNELFDIDHVRRMVTTRKHQMKWVLNNLDAIVDFLSSKCENVPQVKNDPYGFFLGMAAEYRKITQLRLFLDQGLKDKIGRALITAARVNHLVAVNELLERGAPPKISSDIALMYAAQNGNLEMVDVLLNHGAEDEDGSAMKVAKEKNNEDIIARLNRDTPSSWGWLKFWH